MEAEREFQYAGFLFSPYRSSCLPRMWDQVDRAGSRFEESGESLNIRSETKSKSSILTTLLQQESPKCCALPK